MADAVIAGPPLQCSPIKLRKSQMFLWKKNKYWALPTLLLDFTLTDIIDSDILRVIHIHNKWSWLLMFFLCGCSPVCARVCLCACARVRVCLCLDEPAPVGPHLGECQGPGETHVDAGPCWENHCLWGPQPPLAEGRFTHMHAMQMLPISPSLIFKHFLDLPFYGLTFKKQTI